MKIIRLEKTKQNKTKQTNKQTNSDAWEKHPNRDLTSKEQKLNHFS